MTDKEKAIVMAYTGVCMLTGDKFQIFHEYVEKLLGRPVYTHEMAIKVIVDEIKEKAKADFIALCEEQESRWIPVSEKLPEETYAEYWVCTDGGYQCQCRWTNNPFGLGRGGDTWAWSIFDIPQYSKVIAWMPLLESYKIERSSKE